MATRLTDIAIRDLLAGEFDWVEGKFKAILIRESFDLTNDVVFMSDIPHSARASLPISINNKSVSSGSYNAQHFLKFKEVSGGTVSAIVIYQDKGTQDENPVMIVFDKGLGLPCHPNSGDIVSNYPNGGMHLLDGAKRQLKN